MDDTAFRVGAMLVPRHSCRIHPIALGRVDEGIGQSGIHAEMVPRHSCRIDPIALGHVDEGISRRDSCRNGSAAFMPHTPDRA